VDLSRGEYLKAQIKETTESTTFKLIFWGVIIILIAYIALVVSYRIRRARHRKAMRQARLEKARRERLEREERLQKEQEPQRPVNPAARPAVSYMPEKSPVQERNEQAERDYFEEFFKNN